MGSVLDVMAPAVQTSRCLPKLKQSGISRLQPFIQQQHRERLPILHILPLFHLAAQLRSAQVHAEPLPTQQDAYQPAQRQVITATP